jgi:hypothetical protein
VISTERKDKRNVVSLKRLWRIWAKAMGQKATDHDGEADIAAIIRTVFWVVNLITCFFIIANTIRHW